MVIYAHSYFRGLIFCFIFPSFFHAFNGEVVEIVIAVYYSYASRILCFVTLDLI